MNLKSNNSNIQWGQSDYRQIEGQKDERLIPFFAGALVAAPLFYGLGINRPGYGAPGPYGAPVGPVYTGPVYTYPSYPPTYPSYPPTYPSYPPAYGNPPRK